jgi:hypothetical protein
MNKNLQERHNDELLGDISYTNTSGIRILNDEQSAPDTNPLYTIVPYIKHNDSITQPHATSEQHNTSADINIRYHTLGKSIAFYLSDLIFTVYSRIFIHYLYLPLQDISIIGRESRFGG